MRWLPCPGFPDYAVSDGGDIVRGTRGPHTRPGRPVAGKTDRYGYRQVTLRRDGAKYCRTVHRLVLTAFAGAAPTDHQVNHKNLIKTDNRVENLEWVTPAQNVSHAREHGNDQRGETNGRAKLTEQDVMLIRFLNRLGVTQKALAREFGVSLATVSFAASGVTWAHLPQGGHD